MNRSPSRIWIVGSPGSGKSFVADRLAARLGFRAIHLDDHFWLPAWQSRPVDEFRGRVDEATGGDRWIVDGNYNAVRSLFMPRAELVVWLDLGYWCVVGRVVRRTSQRALSRQPVCNGNRESLLRSIFHHDSIIWWTLTQYGRYRRRYTMELADRPHVRLRSPAEVDRWIADFAAAPGARGTA